MCWKDRGEPAFQIRLKKQQPAGRQAVALCIDGPSPCTSKSKKLLYSSNIALYSARKSSIPGISRRIPKTSTIVSRYSSTDRKTGLYAPHFGLCDPQKTLYGAYLFLAREEYHSGLAVFSAASVAAKLTAVRRYRRHFREFPVCGPVYRGYVHFCSFFNRRFLRAFITAYYDYSTSNRCLHDRQTKKQVIRMVFHMI